MDSDRVWLWRFFLAGKGGVAGAPVRRASERRAPDVGEYMAGVGLVSNKLGGWERGVDNR
jgi:hypothetical protein